jgi:small-conductance mechanosensitive channel
MKGHLMNILSEYPWISAVSVFVVAILAGWVVEWAALNRLKAFFAKTETVLDDLILKALRGHVLLWIVLGGLVLAAQLAPLTPSNHKLLYRVTLTFFFVSLTFLAARLMADLIGHFAAKTSASSAMTSLTGQLARLGVLGIGGLLILSNLGISITPILTALGVGSLAVALALQDTLSNLFAGIQIVSTHQVGVGDFVRLDTGQEGQVVDVGWRTTRIQELPGNIIIVPNAKLSQAILVNTALPDPSMAVVVQMGVAYGSDLKKVERVVIETARHIQETVPGAVPGFEPVIRYQTFGDSSINFNVVMRGGQFTDKFLITHEFIKAVHERFNTENIEIPFPQRVMHTVTS